MHGWYGLVTASNPTGFCSILRTHAGWFRRLSDGASLLLGPYGGCGGWVGRSLVWNVPGTNQGDKQTYTQPKKCSNYIIAYLILFIYIQLNWYTKYICICRYVIYVHQYGPSSCTDILRSDQFSWGSEVEGQPISDLSRPPFRIFGEIPWLVKYCALPIQPYKTPSLVWALDLAC